MKTNEKKKLISKIIKNSIIVIFILIYFTNIYIQIKEIGAQNKIKENLKKDIENLSIIKKNKEKELQEIKKESKIEEIARNQLNMKKKGEIVYRIVDK